MPEPFDWSLVTQAAKTWMDEHGTAPGYLLLPINTSVEISEMAAEIYDVETVRSFGADVPRFATALPEPVNHSKLFKEAPTASQRLSERDPLEQSVPKPPSSDELRRQAAIIQLAETGQLTAHDIQMMSMEDYVLVRGILGRQMARAVAGKPAGEVLSMFKKI